LKTAILDNSKGLSYYACDMLPKIMEKITDFHSEHVCDHQHGVFAYTGGNEVKGLILV